MTTTRAQASPSLAGHVSIMRLDHWVKNVFVLPGILVALTAVSGVDLREFLVNTLLGLFAIGLVASSNYVINEVLDAPTDREHPVKHTRPVPAGRVSIPLAYVQWLVLMAAGVGLGLMINQPFALTLLSLWIMGCVYNIPPVRSKDQPYVDVLSEAINNPIRMVAGWYIVAPALVAPISLVLSYWMIGGYFMTLKRYSELRDIGDPARAAKYRRSFAFYTESRLLIAVMFYASASMLFLGAFIIRYRMELVLAFPLLAFVMATYLALALKANSAAQAPERLYREPLLMAAVVATTLVMVFLLFVDLPVLYDILEPTQPLLHP